MSRPHAIARPTLTPAQRRTRIGAPHAGRAAASTRRSISPSFRARTRHCSAAATMRASSKIPSPPISMRCGRALLPSLLAAAQRNQARGFNDLMLFEIGAQFESGMPGAQATVAAGIRVGEPQRSWTKSGTCADAFDAKADMLAGHRDRDGRPDDRAGESRAPLPGIIPAAPARWRSARKVLALFRRTASRRSSPPSISKARLPRSKSSSTPFPNRRAKAKRARRSRRRPFSRWNAISRSWWMRAYPPTK